jgi:cytosine/adenosine deaminase-related metal-dependent hydrolase
MEGRLLLKDCSVFRVDGRIRDHMAVVVEAGRITRVSPDEEVPTLPGDWEVACRGRLVAPGLVDCHTHLVGGQVLPLSGELLLRTPAARFEAQVRIDAQLTAGEVEVLTAFAAAKAVRAGVTMLVEHLHAPGDVAGALAAQARVAERIGVRLVHSHATSSIGGDAAAVAQLEANAAHAKAHRAHPLVRSALGFHASYSCEDDLLRRVGRLREELGLGAHYHLAESDDDLTMTYARHGRRIVPRFESFGLLGPGVVASYAKAIDRSESDRLAKTRTTIALSPHSSLAVETGIGGFESVIAHQNLIGLGTGGTGSLWEELNSAFVAVMHVARVGRLLDPDGLLAQFLVGGPAELCSMLFGLPSGNVEVGNLADLVVFDHAPAKENSGGLTPNLLMQLGQAPIAWTVVGGRVVVREGQLLAADYVELSREAARVLQLIWARSGSSLDPAGSSPVT